MPSERSSSRHSKRRKDGSRYRTSRTAYASVILILLNVFQAAALLGTDRLLITFIAVILSGTGLTLGVSASRKIKRYAGLIQGEGASLLGMWGNLIILVPAGAFFLWELLRSIARGDLNIL